ncbi:putative PucR family transcriptional regulator [Mycobacterium numidiamassiliense]|uniref:Putative PucR family transcriptional regulator n=1 Tax=Mycobacterium numidiamassiliense TaxID=1841861 RepID=A0A2U3PA75_9MYCO|nr:helix-turn-helix domain-containing protein [Mycobacterium numidiamassiliense]SPM40631.1 putative PucR family transcriptional regulator [Mycobacterium numidiamassiliense]
MRLGSHNDVRLAAGNATAGETPAETMRRCAHAMLLRSSQVSAAISADVLSHVAGLTPNGSVQAIKAVHDSTDQNVGAIFATLAFGVPSDAAEPPTGTQDLLRHTVADDGDVTTLLRAYRYGHSLLWEMWSAHVAEQVGEAPRLHEVLSMSSKHMFTFIDRSCERLVSDFQLLYGARSPARPTRSVGETIRDLLLDDTVVDEALASTVLRCDIGGYHVGLVLSPLAAGVDVRAVAGTLSTAAGAASGATLMVGDGTMWSWLTWPRRPGEDRLRRVHDTPAKDVVVGMGEPGRGRSGFARSHQQARDAERVTRLNRNVCGGVVRYRDVELAGALCGDVGRARRFAEDRLSTLISDDPTVERLRETLLVYLDNGCRQSRAAEVLHVHPKTVSYRLAQAQRLLGQPFAEHVLDVGAALTVAQALMGGRPHS